MEVQLQHVLIYQNGPSFFVGLREVVVKRGGEKF